MAEGAFVFSSGPGAHVRPARDFAPAGTGYAIKLLARGEAVVGAQDQFGQAESRKSRDTEGKGGAGDPDGKERGS